MQLLLCRASRVLGLLFSCILVCGCGNSANTDDASPPNEVQKRLLAIGDAYVRATAEKGKPPQSINDLTAKLKLRKDLGKPEDMLRSPDDGQNFEIVFGVNLIGLKETGSDLPIVAFERTGKDGRRHVLRGDRDVQSLSESEIRAGKFPPGYKPPF